MEYDDLLPNGELIREPEILAVGKAAFEAVISLLEKGYNRAEIMESIFTEAHSSAIHSLLKARVRLNKDLNIRTGELKNDSSK